MESNAYLFQVSQAVVLNYKLPPLIHVYIKNVFCQSLEGQ